MHVVHWRFMKNKSKSSKITRPSDISTTTMRCLLPGLFIALTSADSIQILKLSSDSVLKFLASLTRNVSKLRQTLEVDLLYTQHGWELRLRSNLVWFLKEFLTSLRQGR